ncbi:site-specific integrase [Sporosarcina sp. ACRSL]|uniref:site-specific integrase n=1 Tax=Sporosarcina sp. ACRSL TaxID=2918215 RepID=UPI001EF4BF2B|nr:site-specific integrase [Sporosarcina sp. ACRSL]MCG7346373.1 site-specific integrase [Sporosarcina sp. ACRSL]
MNEVQSFRSTKEIDAMKRSLHGRNLLMFTIGINTALRVSDLLQLKVSDVTGEYIEVVESKTGKRKRIKINASIKKAVKTLLSADAKPDDWLFPSRNGGKPITRVQAYRILNEAAERAGLAHMRIGTHTMRKTFGRFAYERGVELPLIMKALNHSSERETLRYIGIEQDDIDSVHIDICL